MSNNLDKLFNKLYKRQKYNVGKMVAYVEPKFSRNFNQRYAMITINRQSIHNNFKNKVMKMLGPDKEDRITYIIHGLADAHVTVWEEPFVKDNGVYHVVSGTKYNKYMPTLGS